MPNNFASRVGIFVLGVAAVPVWQKIVSPVLGELTRNVVREGVKGGIIIKQTVQETVKGVQQDLEDIVADARSEMEADPDHPEGTDNHNK